MLKVKLSGTVVLLCLSTSFLSIGCGDFTGSNDNVRFQGKQNADGDQNGNQNGSNGNRDQSFNGNGGGIDATGQNGVNSDLGGVNDNSCKWMSSKSSRFSLASISNGPDLDPSESIKSIQDLVKKNPGEWHGNDFYVTFKTYQVTDSVNNPEEVGEFLTPPGERTGVHARTDRYERKYSLALMSAKSAICSPSLAQNGDTFKQAGCFDEDTLIKMGDGSLKKIRSIRNGDLVFNPVLKRAFPVSKVTMGYEKQALYEVGYSSATARVTYNHPFLTKMGIKTAEQLTGKDELIGKSGIYHRIKSLKVLPIKKKQVVVNISLKSGSENPQYHMIEADGVVSGDLFLQEQLEKKKMKSKVLAKK